MINPELRVGALVENPRMPQWGPGLVARIRGDNIDIFFRDLGDPDAKTLKRAHLRLASSEQDELLENLPTFVEREGRLFLPHKRTTLEEARQAFLKRFPGGFNDPAYLGNEERGERVYKLRAHERFRQQFGPGNWSDTIDQVDISALVTTLRNVIGRAGNLLAVTENIAFAEGLKDHGAARQYLLTLFALLDSGPNEPAFQAHADAVAGLPTSGATDTDRWPIVTLLPFLARPDVFMFLKPKNTKAAANKLAFDIHYDSTPNWTTYDAVLRMARAYLHRLSDLEPRDYIDVQSFFWVTGETYEKTRAAQRAKRPTRTKA